MLTLTCPVDTPLHHWRAGAKLAGLAGFTLMLFVTDHPVALGLAPALVVALHLATGRHRMLVARHALGLLRPLWPFVAVVLIWHLWTNSATEGAVIVLRMVTAVAAANLVTMTTRLTDMIAVLERLARPLAPVIPPRRLALALALVIRFIPVLSARWSLLSDAWRARSTRRGGWRLVAPAALAALDDAEQVANALRARGGAG